MTKKEHCRCKG